MILVRHFAKLLWGSELLEKLESKVEDLNKAEDGEASEETHRAAHQPDQLENDNFSTAVKIGFLKVSNKFFNYLIDWHFPFLVPLNLVKESSVEENAHSL